MSRKALSYEQNLEKRGIEAAKDRLSKNQSKFDSKIEELKAEIAEVEAAKVQDAENFKTAVQNYSQSLQNNAQSVMNEVSEDTSDEGAATDSEELSEVL